MAGDAAGRQRRVRWRTVPRTLGLEDPASASSAGTPFRKARYRPIADYAIIGDCHTAALISKHGSIDWYCPGRFDAPAALCRLLDFDKGGYFSVSPAAHFQTERSYRGPTNVLDTTFRCSASEVRLTDFMPVHRRAEHRRGHDVGTTRQIMRMVENRGEGCTVDVLFKPTFNFALGATKLELVANKGAIARRGAERLVLYGPKLEDTFIRRDVFSARLRLRPGERAWLVLSMTASERGVREALQAEVSMRDLERTLEYWRAWGKLCQYSGPYLEAVQRSALALKLLTYEPTGAVVAAPTTSLPERIGGVRNWDYRYTWLRDASLMLFALSTLGYHEEATDFIHWLAHTCAADTEREPQVMYTIDGDSDLPEHLLKRLDGYRRSRPVRIGNSASEQHQMDIFGDVLSAAYHFRHTVEDDPRTPVPEPHERLSRRHWNLLRNMVNEAAACWREPDNGIWEARAEPRQYVHSKLMCWTALDRGIRLAEEQGLGAPLERWHKVRDDIRRTILEHGYNPSLGSFTQVLDGDDLDASVLAIPRVGFLPATDRRVQSTVNRIQKRLTRNGLVQRYRTHDGLPGSEGTFVLCSFWMVDALALGGRADEAHELYEKLLGYCNDVGLLSEEIDPTSSRNRLLGNFPQGFSHMALIGSAVNLAYAEEHGAEEHPHTEPERALKAVGG